MRLIYNLSVHKVRLFRLKNNYLDILKDREFWSFVAKYKFTLAFENAVCDDYISEKLWRPLIVGSVPIYYGSPSFKVFYLARENCLFKDSNFISQSNFIH